MTDKLLYTKSSFINEFLVKKNSCNVITAGSRSLRVENGPAYTYIFLEKRDVIDYEEICMHCQKLYLGIPGHSDLKPFANDKLEMTEIITSSKKGKGRGRKDDRRRLE